MAHWEIFNFLYFRASSDFGFDRELDSTSWEGIKSKFPWKTPEASKGLRVVVQKYNQEKDKTEFVYHKSEVFEGFHIIIHDPFELPSRESSHYHAMTNSSVVVWIKVEPSNVTENIHDYTPDEYETIQS